MLGFGFKLMESDPIYFSFTKKLNPNIHAHFRAKMLQSGCCVSSMKSRISRQNGCHKLLLICAVIDVSLPSHKSLGRG
jgi:hypothetical protein